MGGGYETETAGRTCPALYSSLLNAIMAVLYVPAGYNNHASVLHLTGQAMPNFSQPETATL